MQPLIKIESIRLWFKMELFPLRLRSGSTSSSPDFSLSLFYQHYKTSDQAAQRPSRVVPNKVEPEETQRGLRSQAPLSAETGGTAHTAQAADGLIPSHQDTATRAARKL